MKFKTKAVVIEAVRWTGDEGPITSLEWAIAALERGSLLLHQAYGSTLKLLVETPEGIVQAALGDWIVMDAEGKIGLCKSNLFNDLYEACEPLEAPAPAHAPFPARTPAMDPRLKKWVLVVDDDPQVLAMIEGVLEHPGLTVTTASDAFQAFIQARDLKPFLIISDIVMPGGSDGTSMMKRLRDDLTVPAVPIIFMTGMNLDEARKLLPKGDPLIGLIPKPVDHQMLRDYVWKLAGVVAPPDAPSGRPS